MQKQASIIAELQDLRLLLGIEGYVRPSQVWLPVLQFSELLISCDGYAG
jgi:hypothetical protein